LTLGGSQTALHPSLIGLKSLYDQKKLCVIQNVGYDSPSFSHFRSSDIWHTSSNSNEVVDSGWLGRLVNFWYPKFPVGYPNASLADPAAMTLNSSVADAFQGDLINISESVPSSFTGSLAQLTSAANTLVPNTNAGKEVSFLRQQLSTANAFSGQIIKAWTAGKNTVTNYTSSPTGGSGSQLGKQLKIVTRLLSGGIKTKIFLVQMNGFDTHDNQVNSTNTTQGKHALLLQEFDVAIQEFLNDLNSQNLGDRVLCMTSSEFGRRVVSNASNGTDHGTSAPHFLIGNGVNPTIIGANPIIPAGMTSSQNLKHSIHYREMYGAVLQGWFGLSQTDSDQILMHSEKPISAVTAIEKGGINLRGSQRIHALPTPDGQVWVSLREGKSDMATIRIYNLAGQEIFKTRTELTSQPLLINSNQILSSGTYLMQIKGLVNQGTLKWSIP
jgi:uncharacterized protein (DUF1501 family)